MRPLLALLVLTACSEPLAPPTSPVPGGADARAERDREARFACEARGRMASATPAYGGPGMGSLMGGMLSQQGAGDAVTRQCWESYQRRGVLPAS